MSQPKEDNNIVFEAMNEKQRTDKIEGILDEKIRPMLQMDGGNMEILEIKENLPHFDIYIKYTGACDGCASGSSGTLYAIESILQEEIEEENIRVFPV